MQTNPFEQILDKLDRLQTSVDIMSVNTAPKNNKKAEPPNPHRIIDLPEAAKILCKPVGTVRSYIHSRGLPARLVGKSYLIKYSELMEWFEQFGTDGSEQSIKTDSTATEKMKALREQYRK